MFSAEPFLDGALASLRASLPAKLAAIDATTTDFDLPVPQDDGGALGSPGVDYYLGVVATPLRYPLVEVAIPDWLLSTFDIAQLAGDAEATMMVMATLRDASAGTDKLYRMLLRYTRALLNVLVVPAAFGQGAVISSIRGAYRQNPQTREAEEVVGATAIAFTLETADQRE